jgi:hypothetical protein
MKITKGSWVAYRPLIATQTKFGRFNTEIDKNYHLVDIEDVPTKCEIKSTTLIYEKNLIQKLNDEYNRIIKE